MAKRIFECSGCGTSVEKYECRLTRVDIVFCNLTCRNRNYKKALPDWHPPNYREYEHKCTVCGIVFKTTGSSMNAKSRIFCGPVCRGKTIRKGAVLSDETKAKLSVSAAKQNKAYPGKFQYSKNEKVLYMKSNWERLYANWLDFNNINWIYEPEYKLKNGKVYLPDFLLDDGTVVEIKGYFRPDAKVKWDMFCEEYPDIDKKLLQKQELKMLGIIQ